MKGVTQKNYDMYRSDKGLPRQSVQRISDAELQDIYKTRYWDLVKGDELPSGVDYAVFDGAVNSGPGQSIKWLQRALAPVYQGRADGIIGPATLAALDAWVDYDDLIDRMLKLRMAFLRALKGWGTFGRGWTSRVNNVKQAAQAMATGSVGPGPVYVPGGDTKGYIQDAKTAPSTAPGDVMTGGGSAGAVITQTVNQLTPLSNFASVAYIITALTVAGALIAVGGIVWRSWAQRKNSELQNALGLMPDEN